MSFRPNVHDELTLNGVTYRIAEHPAAPGIPYGQEGRAGIVYCLERSPLPSGAPFGDDKGPGVRAALKVFKSRFRTPALVALSARLNEYAQLPGLRACERTVLTPENHPDLLRREPDLTYAVLMPWIEGPTWFDILQEKRPLPPAQSLALASSLTRILTTLEQQGLAHCDLSAPNVLLPALVNPQAASAVELVDVEQMYGLGLPRPESLSSGTAGYAPAHPTDSLWSPNGDRFAGAILLAEMLGWCDENVRQAAWGESYFDPAEIQQDGERYRVLHRALEAHWGKPVADLFERAWKSETLADCPTFGEWQLILPVTAEIQSAFETTALVSAHTATGTALAEAPQVLPWAPRKEESFDAIFRNAIEAYRRREWALARELLIPLVQEAPNYVLEGYTPRALLAEVERQSRRRPVAMWILLAALLLAGIAGIFGAGYAWLREFPAIGALLASPTPYQATPTPGMEYLLPTDAGVITAIKIEGKDSSIEIQRNAENKWEIKAPENVAADQALVGAAVTQLSSLRIMGQVQTDPELVNLKPPDYKVSVTYSNGKTYTFEVGAVTPTNTGCYVLKSDGNIVVVSKTSLDSLLKLLTNPP